MTVIRKTNDGRFLFWCPGCNRAHALDDTWDFNNDFEEPTFNPSIKTWGTIPITDEEHDKIMSGEKITPKPFVCHSFIRNGQIQFLNDCTHELAGQTIKLEEFK